MFRILRPLFTRENSLLLLTLIMVGCLPFAVEEMTRDATLSLLLPVTIVGVFLAWILGSIGVKLAWAEAVFLVFGPLLLFVYIARLGTPLVTLTRETLSIIPDLSSWLRTHVPPDVSYWVAAQSELTGRVTALGQRIAIWIVGTLQGLRVEDPAARAFVWSLGLWLVAAWAGWQVRGAALSRHATLAEALPLGQGRTLAGLLPSTILMGLVLNKTNQEIDILWIHLSALLLLLGLANYEGLSRLWGKRRIDYSDSTAQDSLVAASVITLLLVVTAYSVSSFSVEDFMDRLRERDTTTTSSSGQGSSYSTETTAGYRAPLPGSESLRRSHLILEGPKLSDEVIMFIITGDLPPLPATVNPNAPRYYWRTMTYQTYTGAGWSNPATASIESAAGEILIKAAPPNYRLVRQEVTYPLGASGYLYWTGALLQSDTALQLAWRSQPTANSPSTFPDPLLGADLIGALTSTQSYTAESLLPQVSEADLRAAPAVYPAWVSQRYLKLPDSVPERVRALARDVTAAASTPYDRALAIQTYVRQFPYSLDVPGPPLHRETSDYFIFELKKGYCDYYATTMTVLARAAGLPARFVLGYASGSYDAQNARYIVTKADAHAWSEIYFTGIGWVEFEPTASQPASQRTEESHAPLSTTVTASKRTDWARISSLLGRAVAFVWRPLAMLAVLYFLWIGSDGLRLSRSDPSGTIQRLYRRLRRLARPLSGLPSPGQTAHNYATVLSARLAIFRTPDPLRNLLLAPAGAQIASLTDLYYQSLFAPTPVTRREAQRAIHIWSRLRWRLVLMNLVIYFRRVLRQGWD